MTPKNLDMCEVIERGFSVETFQNLGTYEEQKEYFEKFVAHDIHTNKFVVIENTNKKTHVITLSERQLKKKFSHLKNLVEERGKGGRLTTFVEKWKIDPYHRCVNGVVFNPTKTTGLAFNTFLGYPNHKPETPVSEEQREYYISLLHHIALGHCGGDDWQAQFFINCIARKLQTPTEYHGVFFAFQGCPTTSFFDVLGQLIGEEYYLKTQKTPSFFVKKKESMASKNKILVVMNDFPVNQDSQHAARKIMKKHVAQTIFTWQRRDGYAPLNNYGDECYYVCYDTTPMFGEKNWSLDEKTFHHIAENVLKSPECLSTWKEYLMSLDISNFDPTSAREGALDSSYFNACERHAPLHAKFMISLLRDNEEWIQTHMSNNGSDVTVSGRELQLLFREFIIKRGIVELYSPINNFRRQLEDSYKNVIRQTKTKEGHQAYVFNVRELEELIRSKKWGLKSHDFFKSKIEEKRKEMQVDNQLFEMAKTTPVANPFKRRRL